MSLKHELQTLRKRAENLPLRLILIGFFATLAIWAVVLDFLFKEPQWIVCNCLVGKFLASTLISVGPELAGIAIGFTTIDYLNEMRQEQLSKKQLILQLGSKNRGVADTALRTLKSFEWGFSEEKTLQGAYLDEANLEGAKLQSANLQGASLAFANLQGATLAGANLVGAEMSLANLQGANLTNTNLQGAYLYEANLKGAVLYSTNLKGAKGLTLVQLKEVQRLDKATMPDGSSFEEWILRLLGKGEIDEETFSALHRLILDAHLEEAE